MRLIYDDCLVAMQGLNDNSVDMILTDLPFGITKLKWDTIIPFDKLWEQYTRVIKPNGAILLFGCEPFSSKLRLSNIDWYKYDLYWVKEKATNFMQVKKRAGKLTENICVFYNKQPTYNPQMVKHEGKKVSNNTSAVFKSSVAADSPTLHIKPYKDTGYRYPCDLLYFNREKLGSTLHPTQKPVSLLENLVLTYSNKYDTILDSCMGSGSTGVACLHTERNFIGIENNKKYFEIAKERLKNEKSGCTGV